MIYFLKETRSLIKRYSSTMMKKMPLTKEFLDGVIEDSKAFQKRRVMWAIGELKLNDEPLTLSRV